MRPEARNAVNSALARGLAAAVDTLDADPELSVGVLTGAGGSFCSGMDLKAFLQGELPVVEGRGFAGIIVGANVYIARREARLARAAQTT